MTTVYTEPPGSISLEAGNSSASPFPSPSSSFLPPPTPGAHEFAVKPPLRNARKSSNAQHGDSGSRPTSAMNGTVPVVVAPRYSADLGGVPPASPMTPTPSSIQRQPVVPPSSNSLEPPRSPAPFLSTSSSTTPTIPIAHLPPEEDPKDQIKLSDSLARIIIPTLDETGSTEVPPSPASSNRPVSGLYSNRPAPPSPAISSRRVSGAPSIASSSGGGGRRSRPPSTAVSRANSLRKSTGGAGRGGNAANTSGGGVNPNAATNTGGSPIIPPNPNPNPHRASVGSQLRLSQSFSPLPSPQKASFGMGAASSSQAQVPAQSIPPSVSPPSSSSQQPTSSPKPLIQIKDFAFTPTDARHTGQGVDVPRPNRLRTLNRRLAGGNTNGKTGRTLSVSSFGSFGSSEDGYGDEEDEEEEEDVDGWGYAGFGGVGAYGAGKLGPSQGQVQTRPGGQGGWDGFRMGFARFSYSTGAGGTGTTAASVMGGGGGGESTTSKANGFPTRSDLDRNFLDDASSSTSASASASASTSASTSEEFFDASSGVVRSDPNPNPDTNPDLEDDHDHDLDEEEEEEEEEEEDPLYPGLYRAIYAFEPEGTAEMRLVEDQIVRVVGRGGGVGWAVVVVESVGDSNAIVDSKTIGDSKDVAGVGTDAGVSPDAGVGPDSDGAPNGFTAPKHALVPESYLEPFKLDWELESEGEGEGADEGADEGVVGN